MRFLILSILWTAALVHAQTFETQSVTLEPLIGYVSSNNIPILENFEISINTQVIDSPAVAELNSRSKIVWEKFVNCSGGENQAKANYKLGKICPEVQKEISRLKEQFEIYLSSANAFGTTFNIQCTEPHNESNCRYEQEELRKQHLGIDHFNKYGYDRYFTKMQPYGIHPFFNQIISEILFSDLTVEKGDHKMCGGVFCRDEDSFYMKEVVLAEIKARYIRAVTDDSLAQEIREQWREEYNTMNYDHSQKKYRNVVLNQEQVESRYRKILMGFRLLSLSLPGASNCDSWTLYPDEFWKTLDLADFMTDAQTFEQDLLKDRLTTVCGYKESGEREKSLARIGMTPQKFSGIIAVSFVNKLEAQLNFWKTLRQK